MSCEYNSHVYFNMGISNTTVANQTQQGFSLCSETQKGHL